MSHDWTLTSAENQPLRGNAHALNEGRPRAVVLFAHGFKGYKDYGLIPVLSQAISQAMPVVVHRFNFSHSGIGDDPGTFQHPDLFERDTWNKQVRDLGAVFDAAARGELPATPVGLPIVLMGHSRGGVSCMLMAGRRFRDIAAGTPAAIITLASPARSMGLAPADRDRLAQQGFALSLSSRTGQMLRIGRAWLDEQLAAPEDHDVLAMCGRLTCPVLAVHGEADQTVPPESARKIAAACASSTLMLIPGADHVFNTPNPARNDAPMSDSLEQVRRGVFAFLRDRLPAIGAP